MQRIFFITIFVLLPVVFLQAQKQKVILLDDFSNNANKWPTVIGKMTNYLVYNGKLVINTDDTLTYTNSIPVDLNTQNNFSITITATHTNGIDNSDYGLFFGASNLNNYICYLISNNGFSRSYKIGDDGFVDILKWTENPAIKTGNYVDNVLRISKEGANWIFSVNGQSLATVHALPFYGNKIGVLVSQNQRIEFDDLKMIEY